jgi:hypothetical protein
MTATLWPVCRRVRVEQGAAGSAAANRGSVRRPFAPTDYGLRLQLGDDRYLLDLPVLVGP